MLLDLNDASSILEWWAVYPQRHGALLVDWSRRRPEHRGAIMEARRRIKADPLKRRLLESTLTEQPEGSCLPPPPTHDEQAAGELGPVMRGDPRPSGPLMQRVSARGFADLP